MSVAARWSDHASPAPREMDKDASLLRFITCGSVDDGKSTLIGRLLHDTGSVFEDQIESFRRESRKFNAAENDLNYALLVDGLVSEREQGITIDVAYRYFSTQRRFFIIADTPGHEQYTRNMATGASQADLAIILVDARKGVLPQTRRHSFITSMVGIRSVIIAINKMDLVNFSQTVFDRIVREYRSLLPRLDFREIIFIPVSARLGINVVSRSSRMSWYQGPTLFEYLETVEPANPDRAAATFYLPVQWISRPNPDFRGFCGTVASGSISTGDTIRSLPSGEKSRVSGIYNPAGETESATAGEAVILTLEKEIDTSRGDVLVAGNDETGVSAALRGQILWMSPRPLTVGRRYLIKLAASVVPVTVSQLEEKIDIHSYCSEPATSLDMNEIGLVLLELERPLVAAPYADSHILGAFILIDPENNETAALGTVQETFPHLVAENTQQSRQDFFPVPLTYISDRGDTGRRGTLMMHLAAAFVIGALALFFGASPGGAVCLAVADLVLHLCLHPDRRQRPPAQDGNL